MKRNYTFELKRVTPDYKVVTPREISDRVGMAFKLVGDIVAGNKLELYFEDGFTYKTTPLDVCGYISNSNENDEVYFVTMCTKTLAFEMDVINKKIDVNIIEQLKMA